FTGKANVSQKVPVCHVQRSVKRLHLQVGNGGEPGEPLRHFFESLPVFVQPLGVFSFNAFERRFGKNFFSHSFYLLRAMSEDPVQNNFSLKGRITLRPIETNSQIST